VVKVTYPDPSVDKFGELLMTKFRDRAISFYEMVAANKWAGKSRFQADIAGLTPEQLDIVRRCVIQAIDHGLHDFLFAVGEASDSIQILVDGKNIIELSDGLHGEAYGSKGWIVKFSEYAESHE
jgi:hypothetical protein